MQRRFFLAAVTALAAAAISRSARSAERRRTVAFFVGIPLDHPIFTTRYNAVRQLLTQRGWIADQNIRYRPFYSGSDPNELARVAAAIVAEAPDIIIAGSSTETAAALAATRTIPIIFGTASDPVGSGFVRALERPEGNATGFSNNDPSLSEKWVELLTEIAPRTRHIVMIFNPATTPAAGETYIARLRDVCAQSGLTVTPAPIVNIAGIEPVIAGVAGRPDVGLILPPDSFTFRNAGAIVAAVNTHRLPAIYPFDIFVRAGGLMSYTGGRDEATDMIASYIDLILHGANVAELPVQFSRSFELVLNEKAAATLGLVVPASLRILATRILT